MNLRSNLAKGERQSEKFGAAQDESDDELEEESLLETPLDKVEPYGLFKGTLFSMRILNAYLPLCPLTCLSSELQQEQPQLYDNLTKILNPEEQQIVQAVIVQADANAIASQAVAAATAAQTNGGHRLSLPVGV